MAGAIASLLEDFSPTRRGESLGGGILRAVKAKAEPDLPPPPVVDRQAELIKAAEAKVRAEERDAARQQLDEAIAAEKARYEEELASQRVIWVEQQANQLSMLIVEGIGRIEALVSERVANILKPFVSEAFRQQSAVEFKESLATLLLGEETGPMRIVGPEDLLRALKENLGPHADAIEFLPGDHVEVSVTARDTTVQTQLQAWSDRLEQVLKAES
ncbi:hypothetical protein [Microvirga terrestris]|uniref:Flagellar assembly protein FliH/Type III secretion system HrpE domain-containing protein n=1 Tax=Microvirga terrestris TaxID=2791024 RepID=A0ABS0HQZ6_9HYPH|nr:hypothetical protein [Microvirga terrestris]MBF9195893.1 hypothetical protein [Microvirga terrestris]